MSRILIVEDNLDFAYGLRNNLEIERYQVDVAANGQEALVQDSAAYDLMILDLMLPVLNGFQLLRLFRERGVITPVLVLSAKNEPEDKVRAFSLGADDYVTKPFELRELLARIQALLRRSMIGSNLSVGQKPDSSPLMLTPRETEILALLQQGLSNKVIGRKLDLTSGTVKIYVHNVLQKLHVHSRRQLRSPSDPSTSERS